MITPDVAVCAAPTCSTATPPNTARNAVTDLPLNDCSTSSGASKAGKTYGVTDLTATPGKIANTLGTTWSTMARARLTGHSCATCTSGCQPAARSGRVRSAFRLFLFRRRRAGESWTALRALTDALID